MKPKRKALSPIPETQRIYLNVDYKPRRFAEETGCRYDPMKELWFTWWNHSMAEVLIRRYGIHEQTSPMALESLKSKGPNQD